MTYSTSLGRKYHVFCWATMLLCLGACDRVARFDNADGSAFCGHVVSGTFVRKGFTPRAKMQLRLDVDSFHDFPGTITVEDDVTGRCSTEAMFSDARLRISRKLQADPIAAMLFGESQEMNLLTWVDSQCEGTYLAVISLLRNDTVEVRLMKSHADENGREDGPFGVFHLLRHKTGCAE